MAIVKIIEVLAQGSTIEAATEAALAEASETVKNIKNIYIQDMQAIVENNKITTYRVNAKISFLVGKE